MIFAGNLVFEQLVIIGELIRVVMSRKLQDRILDKSIGINAYIMSHKLE